MSLEQFAQISNYSVASATVVVALAFLAHVAEWGFARQPALQLAPASIVNGPQSGPLDEASQPGELRAPRSDVFSSIGVSLTTLATLILWVGVLTRWAAAQRDVGGRAGR